MTRIIAVVLVIFFGITALTGCYNPLSRTDDQNTVEQLPDILLGYSKMVNGELPHDVRLTICYLDPEIDTRYPLSGEDLMKGFRDRMIVVEYEELINHVALLRKLDTSVLQPVKEKSYINARLYYAFNVGDSEAILEVIISEINGSVFVNGIEVENNPVFYELLAPFLTDDDRDILGI